MSEAEIFRNGYSEVNGLKMYYEIHGRLGLPLVLIHGGGSTIDSSFGNLIPLLAKDRRIIAMELQAHGRTSDRDADLSFAQDADDVATLLQNLNVKKADVLGFSNGGQTAIELALRHKDLLRKVIFASAFYKRSAIPEAFWAGFENVSLDQMPPALKEAFLKVNDDLAAFENMFRRDVKRMKNFQGWTEAQLASITLPALIMNGNQDVCDHQHAIEMQRLIQGSQLAILPGGHGEYIGSAESLNGREWKHPYGAELITAFLEVRLD